MTTYQADEAIQLVPQNSPNDPSLVNKSDGDRFMAAKSKAYQANMKRAKALVASLIDSRPFVVVMSLFTIWALFSDDVRLVWTNKSEDLAFVVVISIGFFLFLLEIVAASFSKEGYLNIESWAPKKGENITDTWTRRMRIGSFYFWLDWIATLTLLFEAMHS